MFFTRSFWTSLLDLAQRLWAAGLSGAGPGVPSASGVAQWSWSQGSKGAVTWGCRPGNRPFGCPCWHRARRRGTRRLAGAQQGLTTYTGGLQPQQENGRIKNPQKMRCWWVNPAPVSADYPWQQSLCKPALWGAGPGLGGATGQVPVRSSLPWAGTWPRLGTLRRSAGWQVEY